MCREQPYDTSASESLAPISRCIERSILTHDISDSIQLTCNNLTLYYSHQILRVQQRTCNFVGLRGVLQFHESLQVFSNGSNSFHSVISLQSFQNHRHVLPARSSALRNEVHVSHRAAPQPSMTTSQKKFPLIWKNKFLVHKLAPVQFDRNHVPQHHTKPAEHPDRSHFTFPTQPHSFPSEARMGKILLTDFDKLWK